MIHDKPLSLLEFTSEKHSYLSVGLFFSIAFRMYLDSLKIVGLSYLDQGYSTYLIRWAVGNCYQFMNL